MKVLKHPVGSALHVAQALLDFPDYQVMVMDREGRLFQVERFMFDGLNKRFIFVDPEGIEKSSEYARKVDEQIKALYNNYPNLSSSL